LEKILPSFIIHDFKLDNDKKVMIINDAINIYNNVTFSFNNYYECVKFPDMVSPCQNAGYFLGYAL